MQRLIILSNRLPYKVKLDSDDITVYPSVGGLTTGMQSVYANRDSLWIGWAGVEKESIDAAQQRTIESELHSRGCVPVFLDKKDVDGYYYGFSNETLWPLFHYFMQFTTYDTATWNTYVRVNRLFADQVKQHINGDECVWVHDYHLMLLPAMIKEEFPGVSIGFFLHIPFPSFEVLRILPWRDALVDGMLGADLIGFHTFDYARHFISSVKRLNGYDVNFNRINLANRVVKADAFPMGIDYDKFSGAAHGITNAAAHDTPSIHTEVKRYFRANPEGRLILSIDRLDYSKGIPHRLTAFLRFLEKYPQYHGKVTLIMLTVPSRSKLPKYKEMKHEVDRLVGHINGAFGTIDWTPVWYFYRSMPFENLVVLYTYADVALLTPVRDGMNLVAKEFVASKTDRTGVLILSEMTGASHELSEALIINPNNEEQIADALDRALQMPRSQQHKRMAIMQERLRRYDVKKWAHDFLGRLDEIVALQCTHYAQRVHPDAIARMKTAYSGATRRILFLDYNGTLIPRRRNPGKAVPDQDLYELLQRLQRTADTRIVLITGWSRDTIGTWFDRSSYCLIAEHGTWISTPDNDWQLMEGPHNEWIDNVRPLLDAYADRTPGAYVEQASHSLIWHYRKTNPELATIRAEELKNELHALIDSYHFELYQGNRMLELKNAGVNKGTAAQRLLGHEEYDFVAAVGDETSDEYLFARMPEHAWTLKVGIETGTALYTIENHRQVRTLLDTLAHS